MLELLCLLYIFIVSDLRYTARKTVAGKIYNRWAILFADVFATVTSMADMIKRLIEYNDNTIGFGYNDNTIAMGATIGLNVVLWFVLLEG